jgi:glutamate-1-semialdehyde aminotransferase
MTDRELRERARAVIPGGMYGHQAAPGPAYPQFMRGGRGARVWDVDGNEYVDLMRVIQEFWMLCGVYLSPRRVGIKG